MRRLPKLLNCGALLLLGCGAKPNGGGDEVGTKTEPMDAAVSDGGDEGERPPHDPPSLPDLKSCKSDDECVLTARSFEGEDRCCVFCSGHEAVNKEALEAFVATCDGISQSDCPRGGCAPPPPIVTKCIDDRCKAITGPQVMTPCESDADCTIANGVVRGEGSCCPNCGDVSINKASSAKLDAWCKDQRPLHDCPEYDCAPGKSTSVCVEGQCTARAATPEPAAPGH